jgi:hypothetical protein
MDVSTPHDNVDDRAIEQIARLVVEQMEDSLNTTPPSTPSADDPSY